MLNFIRTHQRKFLIVITVVTVSSFIFFGTFSTFSQPQVREAPDREIVKGVNGKPLMRKEMQALCQMLATSALLPGNERQGMPNVLNDGVIEKELLPSGLELLLVEHYFDALKPELEERLAKMRRFRSYVHPVAPHISARNAWQRFSPALLQRLELLSKQETLTLETFALMLQIYLDQTAFPPEMLKQVLYFQQQQQGVSPDPHLAQSDLSLFGFTSLEEWFGPAFVQLNAQFIANAALLAEERGYVIKRDEVLSDLFQNIRAGFKRFGANGSSGQELQNYFHRKMQQMGVDEKGLVNAWKKGMLFRRLFADVGGSVLIDALAFQQFQEYSQKCVEVDLYEIPSSLQLKDFQSMLKLQVYLESISDNRDKSQLSLPRQFLSVEHVEKRCPELVVRDVEIEYAEVKKSDLSSEISLKETWDWELSDGHFAVLADQFEELRGVAKQERLQALDALDSKKRLAVDAFARSKMMDEARPKVLAALDRVSFEKANIYLRLQGGALPLSVKDRARLLSLLESAPIVEENALVDETQPLYCFSDDQEHFYRIKVLKREDEKRVLAFAEALADGSLDQMLNRRLEEAYEGVRKKQPAAFQQDKGGGWKPLKEVKDRVGRIVFSDLLKAIEEYYIAHIGPLPGKAGELPLVFYSNYRLFPHCEEMRQRLQSGAEDLPTQWQLQRQTRSVKRSEPIAIGKEEMFSLLPEQWSPVKLGSGGALAFYKVIKQTENAALSPEQIAQGHATLALDAKKQLMRELIAQIEQRKAIHIVEEGADER